MTTRRHLLFALGAGVLVRVPVLAQPSAGKPVRVGILVDFTEADYRAIGQPFIETLRALGWIEGRHRDARLTVELSLTTLSAIAADPAIQ